MVIKTADQLLVIQSSTETGCGTGEGASCCVPQNSQAAACGCQSDTTVIALDQVPVKLSEAVRHNQVSRWQNIRSAAMFAVACLFSPCCTPLIVPALLALLGGTPIAIWLGHNLGLIYGVLTLLSVISLVLALRWMKKDATQHAHLAHPSPSSQPFNPTQQSS